MDFYGSSERMSICLFIFFTIPDASEHEMDELIPDCIS